MRIGNLEQEELDPDRLRADPALGQELREVVKRLLLAEEVRAAIQRLPAETCHPDLNGLNDAKRRANILVRGALRRPAAEKIPLPLWDSHRRAPRIQAGSI